MHATPPPARIPKTDFRVRSAFFAPPPEFDGCFTTFYHMSLTVQGDAVLHDQLQPEWGNIRFFAGSRPNARLGETRVDGRCYTATGPSTLPAHFELGSCRMWGIGFLPLGWARFVDGDAEDFCNHAYDAEHTPAFRKFAALMGPLCNEDGDIDDQLAIIIDTMRTLMKPTRDDDKILRVHRAMVDPALTSVAAFAERSEMSIRTLERLCCRYFGFSPKLLLRRQRFMRSLSAFMLHQGSNWTEAMDEHYHDQAQFTREFREFMEMSPTEYAAMDHPIIASFVEARARMWGSAAQTLDKPG